MTFFARHDLCEMWVMETLDWANDLLAGDDVTISAFNIPLIKNIYSNLPFVSSYPIIHQYSNSAAT